MATSSRQSSIFGTNDWKAIYKTFSQANFQSYDYETLRKSFIDYLRLYYPETFNDYVESSEFIALLDLMAFMGQSLAFRDDLNTRENFIDTAERRDSVIKLANLVGYNPKRNLAGQGFLKVSSIQTTENLNDINGLNLNNAEVIWNDPANNYWQDQFNAIINAALINSQHVGRPGHSSTILGVKTDEYSISIPPQSLPVLPFSTTVDGTGMTFELVSATSLNQDYIYEVPPAPRGLFNILYRNDNLGYGSPNTGFFIYFKQGTLKNYDFSFDQQISNQLVDINIQGVNNTDTWLYQLDTLTNSLTEWAAVDSVFSNYNTQANAGSRKVFSVVSRFNDQVSYSFGDGVFSQIPVGTFRAYVRAGNSLQYSIDPAEMSAVSIALNYVSRVGRTETLTINLSLLLPVNNAQLRESLPQIKQRAPTRYYSQNRMVNGEDYNNFPYTLYSSIIKSKALNRASVGTSRNFDLLDPTGKYSSTNSFGQDGALYGYDLDDSQTGTFNSDNEIESFLRKNLKSILSGHRSLQYYSGIYPRYDVISDVGEGHVYWKQISYDNLSATGYLYTELGNPMPTGNYSTINTKYVTSGALLKFESPSGYYFDGNNRLVSGIPSPSDSTYLWVSVLNVVGDGYNNGQGLLNNGLGPISLSSGIPSGAILSLVLPVFDNSLPISVLQECVTRIRLNQSFSLVYNNSLLMNQTRWATQGYTNPNYFVRFKSEGNNRYVVSSKSLKYYFGSVADTRFTFSKDKVIYDPLSGKLLQDHITILKTNTAPDSDYPLSSEVKLNVVGQTVESDGYVDDFAIEVSNTDINNGSIIREPDFFNKVTGYILGGSGTGHYTFFRQTIDFNQLTRFQIVANSDVAYAYPTLAKVELVKYEYPVGQVFFAYLESKFYISKMDPIIPNLVNITTVTGYSVAGGRQGLYFQYRHNSANTSRVDPTTTNIIDLYIVTQAYHTSYQNYIRDTSNVISEPSIPTIQELSQAYGKINDYKMISDSVIPNSVQFKPLFGIKAAANLRATIKVIRSGTTTASDSEIRSSVLSAMDSYFSIDNWDFGDTFYFSELSAYLHSSLGDIISSAVLVPNDPTLTFGDLYEIRSAPYEIFVNAAQASDITVISALTPAELKTN